MNTKKYELALNVIADQTNIAQDEALHEAAYDLDQLEGRIRRGAKDLSERFARDAASFDCRWSVNTINTSALSEQSQMVAEFATRERCFLSLIKVLAGIDAARSYRQEVTRLYEEEAAARSKEAV